MPGEPCKNGEREILLLQYAPVSGICLLPKSQKAFQFSAFQPLQVLFAKFAYFWGNHNLAVGLAAVLRVVVLMVIFGFIKGVGCGHLGNDLVAPHPSSRAFPDHLLGCRLLLVAVIEDG